MKREQADDPFHYFCIVCQKEIQTTLREVKREAIHASVYWGGWYCGHHTEAQLVEAKERIGTGKFIDRHGNVLQV